MPERFLIIACEVLYREVCLAVACSKNIVDIEFVTQGLHDIESVDMCARIQAIVDKTGPGKYAAILLGYGLCNNGIRGLTARGSRIVVPRAHDCITLFLGSKERYRQYFDNNPGTYFKTTGWIERDEVNMESMPSTKMGELGLDKTLQEYIDMYGEENARYIMETMGEGLENYRKYAYIELEFAKKLGYAKQTEKEASEKKWEYERIKGDSRLIEMLVEGEWPDKDFLVVNPGQKIAVTNSEDIICAIENDS
jgi:Protein of unknown function (DUF1638)